MARPQRCKNKRPNRNCAARVLGERPRRGPFVALAYIVVLAASAALVSGCFSERYKKSRASSSFRVYLETAGSPEGQSQVVMIPREGGVNVSIQAEPFISEANVVEAHIISTRGGFSISVHLDPRGRWLLEQYSAENRGKRLAIFSEFGDKMRQNRWLAAPLLSRTISDGMLTFTPDVSHEEAEQLVLGLNNVARKVQDKNTW
jgi:hypothetical protein